MTGYTDDELVDVLRVGACDRNCGNLASPSHTCPFSEEIHNDDTECNCCPSCTHECAMDI